MLNIGQFARLGQVSPRMLRHYDEIGLLRPSRVDPQTGYRSYEVAQLGTLHRLLALRDLGLTLEQIRPMLGDDPSTEQLRGMLPTPPSTDRTRRHRRTGPPPPSRSTPPSSRRESIHARQRRRHQANRATANRRGIRERPLGLVLCWAMSSDVSTRSHRPPNRSGRDPGLCVAWYEDTPAMMAVSSCTPVSTSARRPCPTATACTSSSCQSYRSHRSCTGRPWTASSPSTRASYAG